MIHRNRTSFENLINSTPAKNCWGEAMIIEITNIVAGLILAMGILPSIPAVGDSLEKVAKWLGRF